MDGHVREAIIAGRRAVYYGRTGDSQVEWLLSRARGEGAEMAARKSPSTRLRRIWAIGCASVSDQVSHAFGRKVAARGVTVAEWVVLRTLIDEDFDGAQHPCRPTWGDARNDLKARRPPRRQGVGGADGGPERRPLAPAGADGERGEDLRRFWPPSRTPTTPGLRPI